MRRFRRHPLAVIGLVLFILVLILTLSAPFIDRYPYEQLNLRDKFLSPSTAHWLGTDRVGRDIWSRLLHGGRVSLLVGVSSAAMTIGIGTLLGVLSGYYGGIVDMLIMRFTDVVMTFPGVVIILTVATFLGPSIWNVIMLIGLFGWMGTAPAGAIRSRGRSRTMSRAPATGSGRIPSARCGVKVRGAVPPAGA